MSGNLFKTACHNLHQLHGARMVDFAGWEMPVQYTSIREEHNAVRNAAGLFDIGHMGRFRFTGPDALRLVDYVVTNDVTRLESGQICYALVTNEQGGVLDDVLVYRFDEFLLMVVNASNRLKILDWIGEHQKAGFEVRIEDVTLETAMIALQGPRALDILHPLVNYDPAETSYFWGAEAEVLNVPCIVSRTGYTGEDGFEIVVGADQGHHVWETLIEHGKEHALLPAGLGCRDTLRLEAAMPLYGHELSESIDPLTAGLSFAVKLDAGDFVGKQALVEAKARPDRPKRVGLELSGRRIGRQGAVVLRGDRPVGEVTSGTFSPTLEKSIAMAYVERSESETGNELDVDIRGKRAKASVVKLPFYRRPRR